MCAGLVDAATYRPSGVAASSSPAVANRHGRTSIIRGCRSKASEACLTSASQEAQTSKGPPAPLVPLVVRVFVPPTYGPRNGLEINILHERHLIGDVCEPVAVSASKVGAKSVGT